jgi:hypothetical protein
VWAKLIRGEKTRGQIKIGPLLSKGDPNWPDCYAFTGGAAFIKQRTNKGDTLLAQLFIDFHTIVVRDGIDPLVAHRAFLAIGEYREAMSPDCPKDEAA